MRRLLPIFLLSCLAEAGEIPLQWSRVTVPSGVVLLGYEVYRGSQPGVYGPPTFVRLCSGAIGEIPATNCIVAAAPRYNVDVADCLGHFVAVKTRGLNCVTTGATCSSSSFSNELADQWPSVTVSSVTPDRWPAGQSTGARVIGSNFRTPMTVAETSTDVTLSGLQVVSCSELMYSAAVASVFTAGLVPIEYRNADGSSVVRGVELFSGGVVLPAPTDLGRVDVRPGEPTGPTEVVVNDGDPGTSKTGTWSATTPGTVSPGAWQGDWEFSSATGATYTFSAGPLSGTYEVFEQHEARSSRAAAVMVLVADGPEVLSTPTVNHQINGGRWNSLGTFAFTGEARVGLSRLSTSGSVCADAIRFVRQ
jgi:hypothetical protein